MAKLNNYKRVIFPAGSQKAFLFKVRTKLNIPWKKIAQLLTVSDRTLSDWKREKFTISLQATNLLVRKTKVALPKKIKIMEPFWYVFKGARAGGIKVYKKYGIVGGNPDYRKNKWRQWWKTKGKYQSHPIINVSFPIKEPAKSSELAEFVGILIGDGGISKNQVVITQHYIDDKDYCNFIIRLVKKLFGINPSVYHRPQFSINNIVISRVKLVKFLNSIGLPIGNKINQQIDIPGWIKTNRNYMIACIRGLVDTDGSVFRHSYTVKHKIYSYKKMSFSSRSKPLISSVYHFLKKSGLSSRITKNNFEIRIEAQKNVKKYFCLIGSHNPKHLNRYLK